jgi:hypothetical protein
MTETPDTSPPATFRARCTDDLVAMAPIAIGFHPAQSIVMLTFGGPQPFHARVDLPDHPDDVGPVVATLLAPARRHRVESAAFLLYTPDGPAAVPVASALCERFRAAGVDVVDAVRVAGGHWYPVLPGHPPADYGGVPCDPGAHPFAARAVLEGHVTLGSRDEVRGSVEPDPDGVRRTRAVMASRPPAPLDPARAMEVVGRCVATGTTADDDEAVRLALAVRSGAVRDLVWGRLERSAAPGHVDFWRDVVRRLPEDLVASAAAVLAFCAWLAGDGALAWCAVDRAQAAEPDHSLARLVSDLLSTATPPAAWANLQHGPGPDDGVGDVA